MSIRWLVVAAVSAVASAGVVLAGESPEELMTRHYTDAKLLSAVPVAAAAPTPRALPEDLPKEHWTVVTPADAVREGLMENASDGRFHPSRLVTRGELEAVLTRLTAAGAHARPQARRTPQTPVLTGDRGDGDASAAARRSDLARGLAAVLCNFTTADSLRQAMDDAAESYNDLPEGDPLFAAVMGVRELGLVRGCQDGAFHAEDPFTRAELAESIVWAWRLIREAPNAEKPAEEGTITPAKPAEPVTESQPPAAGESAAESQASPDDGSHWTAEEPAAADKPGDPLWRRK